MSGEESNTGSTQRSVFDLTSWVKRVRDEDLVHLSAREDDTWVDRDRLIDRDEQYTLGADPDRDVRYQLQAGDDREQVVKWIRFTFTETSKFVSGTPANATEIVLELHESVIEGGLPWQNSDAVELSTGVFGWGTENGHFEPVNARRVAGLDEQKRRLDRFLDTDRREWGLTEETGILLEGPPGTGKTELVMEVCQERYGSLPVMISGPEFLSKWVGESEKMLRAKFDEARDTRHMVIYIDEIDAITRDRGDLHEDYSARIVSQLLVLLDGVEAKTENEADERSLKVIASTNIPHIVDEALKRPGRLGARPIQFDRPNWFARKAILHHYLERVYTSEQGQLGPQLRDFVTGQDLGVLDEIVEKTEGFTGANLEDLIQESVSRLREEGRTRLTLSILERIYEESFNRANELVSIELAESDLSTTGPEISADVTLVRMDPETMASEEPALDIAKAYFGRLIADSERELDCTFRVTNPKVLLETEIAQSESNVIEAFEHSESERVCLYLENAEQLVHAKRYSSTVDDLIGVINEQLLQWSDENLLLLGPLSESERRELTSLEPYNV